VILFCFFAELKYRSKQRRYRPYMEMSFQVTMLELARKVSVSAVFETSFAFIKHTKFARYCAK
jgi:hypothetical protein